MSTSSGFPTITCPFYMVTIDSNPKTGNIMGVLLVLHVACCYVRYTFSDISLLLYITFMKMYFESKVYHVINWINFNTYNISPTSGTIEVIHCQKYLYASLLD